MIFWYVPHWYAMKALASLVRFVQAQQSLRYLYTQVMDVYATSKDNSPVENQNDLELDFKVFFFVDSCC